MTTDPPQPDELDPGFNKPFVEHLDDLRRTLLLSAAFLVAGMAAAIPLAPVVLELAKDPVARAGRDPDEFLRVIHIAGGLGLAVRIILWTGLLFSAPFVLIAIARFVFPGLRTKEKKGVRMAVWSTVLLFCVGVVMCYFVTLPVAINLMFSVNDWMGLQAPWVEIGDYIAFVLKLLIAFGAAFEVPVVLLTLGSIGILSSAKLRKYRRHAIVIILICSMLLTPPDVFTQVFMAIPMIILYEFCVWAVYIKEKRRHKE